MCETNPIWPGRRVNAQNEPNFSIADWHLMIGGGPPAPLGTASAEGRFCSDLRGLVARG
jgi:hypothetical protein